MTPNDKTIIAFPDVRKGNVRIKSFDNNNYDHVFVCCESLVACLKFNNEGTLLATASEKVFKHYNFIKGTIIRIFRVSDGTFLHEVRRGKKTAKIHDISFNTNSYLITCISDHGTVHIFSLGTIKEKLMSIKKGESNFEIKEDEPELPTQKSSLYK